MNTNQTIDCVPRELLVRLCNFHAAGWEDIEPEIKELRALLDAPAKPAEGLEADNVKLAADRATLSAELETLRKAYRGALAQLDAAQPQGEPVAVGRVSYIGNGFVRVSLSGATPLLESLLYAEQPAPVAHTMKSVMEAICSIDGLPMLTSNQCHALAVKLNEKPEPVAAVRMCDCNQGRMECNGKCKPEAPKSGPCKFEPVSTGLNVGEGHSRPLLMLPPKKDWSDQPFMSNESGCRQGWNACLDEVTRLNATAKIPEKLEMRDGLHTYEYVTGHNAAIDKILGIK